MKIKNILLFTLFLVLLPSHHLRLVQAILIGHWRFDEVKGTIAKDSSGNDFNGEVIGGPQWHNEGALSLDGVDDYINIREIGGFSESKSRTLIVWIKTTSLEGTILYCASQGNILDFAITNSNLRVSYNGKRVNSLTLINDNKWHQVAATLEYSDKQDVEQGIKLYIDGMLDLVNEGTRPFNNTYISKGMNIGAKGKRSSFLGFHGLLKDLSVYDHAMDRDQVLELYMEKAGADISLGMKKLFTVLDESKNASRKLEPKDAVVFLEKRIQALGQVEGVDVVKNASHRKQILAELQYLLLLAQVASKSSSVDIAMKYEQLIIAERFSLSKEAEVFLWLYENVGDNEFERVASLLIESSADCFRPAMLAFDKLISNEKAEISKLCLQKIITIYQSWREKNQHKRLVFEDRLPMLYQKLGKSRETCGDSKESIAKAYRNAFLPSRFIHTTAQTEDMIWLIENDFIDICKNIVKDNTDKYFKAPSSGIISSQNSKGKGKKVASSKGTLEDSEEGTSFIKVIGNVCSHFESAGDWDSYKSLIEMVFAEAKYPVEWAFIIENRLSDKNNYWASGFYEACRENEHVRFYDELKNARQSAQEGNHKNAIEMYNNILSKCRSTEEKANFEYELYKNMFFTGMYSEVTSKIDNFIANNRATHRDLVIEALFLKGRSNIYLDKTEEALGIFFNIIIDYPEAKGNPEGVFFMGYAYFLQDNFEEASKIFNELAVAYPDSAYASKAKLCLIRIDSELKSKR